MPTIILPARCDRAAAEVLLLEMAAAAQAGRIEIDGSQVEQIGQAMLQVLVSVRCSGGGATIVPSAALAEAGRMTSLSGELFGEARP